MHPSASTLASPLVADLLTRLFADAHATSAEMRQMLGAIPSEERTRRMGDPNADYLEFYHRVKDVHMAVAPATGRLLYMLARSAGARAIVEFGTSFGLSTIHLAAALRDNGGGRLIGTDLEPGKIAFARTNLEAAGLADLVEIREGDALETLAGNLPDSIDLVLLDGHKPLYSRILDLLEPRLRTGAWLIADNADASPGYVARVRSAGGGYLSVPFGDEVEVSMRT